MWDCYQQQLVNPASQHTDGRAARRLLENARESIATALNARSAAHQTDQLIFTSGGTEANNLAIFGLAGKPPGRLLVSAIEHPSVLVAAQQQQRLGFDVKFLPVNSKGTIDLDSLRDSLTGDTRLVSVMYANNETGIIQPVEAISHICREHGTLFHCDAVQAVGKINVSFKQLDCAAMTFSAHKFHGPVGVGGLLVRHDVAVQPQLFGGAQQYALRPGTESVALAVGAARALELFHADPSRSARLLKLRDRFERLLLEDIPDLLIVGYESPRLPHTTNICFSKIDRQAFLMAADLLGLSISSGSACASGSSEPSHVLQAMGLESQLIDGSLRVSCGAGTTMAEVELAARHIFRIANDLGAAK
jgi:cysteine desulfurase